VTEGRRREFAGFPEFSDPAARERIPDPQARRRSSAAGSTGPSASAPGHAEVLALYTRLLALRLEHPALGASLEPRARAVAPDEDTILLHRGEGFWIVARLRGEGTVDLAHAAGEPLGRAGWDVVLTTEEPQFARDPQPPSSCGIRRGRR
jgi:maltooligosyltrehalose trehalohydrolase